MDKLNELVEVVREVKKMASKHKKIYNQVLNEKKQCVNLFEFIDLIKEEKTDYEEVIRISKDYLENEEDFDYLIKWKQFFEESYKNLEEYIKENIK